MTKVKHTPTDRCDKIGDWHGDPDLRYEWRVGI